MTEKITNNVLPILKYFYGSVKGKKDIDLKDQDVLATANTLDYLFDCGFTTAEITREIGRHRRIYPKTFGTAALLKRARFIFIDRLGLCQVLRSTALKPMKQ